MVIEKRDGYRQRQGLVLGFLVFYFVALQCEHANAFRLSRNPLFNGMLNRRNAIPATNIANLHHNQLFKNNFNQHQFYTQQQQQQQQQEPPVAASSSSVVTTNSLNTNHVDPYVSGSNPADKEVAENPDLDQIAADAQVEQKSANLVASASSTSYSSTVGGAGAYGAGSGSSSLGSYGGISAGSGYGGISAGSGYGGISAGSGYGGGSIGSYGDTGGASYGSSGSYGGSSIGSGSSYGGFSGGSNYGSSGLGGSSYGIGGSTGLGGSHSSYGGGGGGYGTSAPSYSISYPAQQGATKADTIHLLSSLAPSLLLSSLLLPLALALLTNTTNSLIGRKRRDLSDDYDDDLQFSLNGDILDGDITLLDAHFFPTMDAMLESYSPEDTERLAEFVRHRGLLDIHNPCLEKLACLATTTNGKFKRYDSLKKAITLLEKSTDPDIKKRLKKGSSVGAKKERNCLTKFICKSMKSAVSP